VIVEWYGIHAFNFSSSQAAVIGGFVLVYWLIRNEQGKDVANKLSNLFYLFIMVWKFSSVLIYWEIVLREPMVVLYYNGGDWGIRLGIAGVIIWLMIYRRSEQKMYQTALKAWVLFLLSFETIKILLTVASWLEWIVLIGLLVMFLAIWSKKVNMFEKVPVLTLAVVLSFQWLLISLHGEWMTNGFVNTLIVSAILLLLNRKERFS